MLLLWFGLLALLAPVFAPASPLQVNLDGALRAPGTAGAWLGTDQLGRDILSRLLHGGRATLSLAFPVALIVTAIAVTIGLTAGYFGGWIDMILSGCINTLLALPGLVISLAILAILGPGRGGLLVALVAAGWAGFARLIRGTTLALRQAEYVEAAVALGASHPQILWRHILPNLAAQVLVIATLDLGSVILSIAALSFLGLGDQPPAADWGAMLNDGRPFFRTYPHLMVLPGLCIFLVVLGANLLGDAMRDLTDPRFR